MNSKPQDLLASIKSEKESNEFVEDHEDEFSYQSDDTEADNIRDFFLIGLGELIK
jgi:hypothetical protein